MKYRKSTFNPLTTVLSWPAGLLFCLLCVLCTDLLTTKALFSEDQSEERVIRWRKRGNYISETQKAKKADEVSSLNTSSIRPRIGSGIVFSTKFKTVKVQSDVVNVSWKKKILLFQNIDIFYDKIWNFFGHVLNPGWRWGECEIDFPSTHARARGSKRLAREGAHALLRHLIVERGWLEIKP